MTRVPYRSSSRDLLWFLPAHLGTLHPVRGRTFGIRFRVQFGVSGGGVQRVSHNPRTLPLRSPPTSPARTSTSLVAMFWAVPGVRGQVPASLESLDRQHKLEREVDQGN